MSSSHGSHGLSTVVSRQIVLTNGFTEALATELRDNWRGGILLAQAHIGPGPILSYSDSTVYHFITVDVRVQGFIGATPTTICRGSVDGKAGPLVLQLSDLAPYSRLVVMARRRIDGGDRSYNETLYAPGTGPVIDFSAQVRFLSQ